MLFVTLMLRPALMHHISVRVAQFIAAEMRAVDVLLGFCSAFGKLAMITMVGAEVVIDVPVKIMRPVKPGTGANETAIYEPFGTIISVWCALIRWDSEIAVRTDGSRSDIDGDLRLCPRRR